jgi:hypothetical protein
MSDCLPRPDGSRSAGATPGAGAALEWTTRGSLPVLTRSTTSATLSRGRSLPMEPTRSPNRIVSVVSAFAF